MKRKTMGLVLITALCMAAFAKPSFVADRAVVATEFEEETKKVNDKKAELVNKRESLREKMQSLEKEKKNVMKYIEKLDGQLGSLKEEEDKLSEDVKLTKKELKQVKKQLQTAKENESSQYEIMKKRIKYMYENGSVDYLEIIFSAKSVAEMLNRAEYVGKMSKYDETLLQAYQETKEKVEAKEREASGKLSDLNLLKEELAIQKEAIDQMASDKEKELKKHERELNNSGKQMQAYTEEIEKQERILDDLILKEQKRIQEEVQKQLQKQQEEQKKQEQDDPDQEGTGDEPTQTPQVKNTIANTSGFRWPLNVAGTITSYFGPRVSPTAGASSYHQGIDIGVPTGTPIVASQSGTVVTATYQSAAGNYVMIHHGESTFTVYMHCSKLAASVGQEVKQGDVIGYVGSTGISTGPHLHFGVSVNGKYVNPLGYVSR